MALGLSLLPRLSDILPGACIIEAPDTPPFHNAGFNPSSTTRYIVRAGPNANNIARLKDLFVRIPREIKKHKSNVCLTMGDIGPVRLPCPHVIFLQQAFIVYGADFGTWSLAKRVYLMRHFAASAKQADAFIVQTPVMAERLASRFHLPREKIHVIAQPVPHHVVSRLETAERYLPITRFSEPLKLLFLAAYYPHKNHRVLPGLVKAIREKGLVGKVRIFLTVDHSERFLSSIIGLEDVLTNLGRIPYDDVAAALKSSTGLFLPTLSESFGLIYLEAIAAKLPILTSDRDFARHMARESAIYFDPLDPADIATKIAELPDFAERNQTVGTSTHLASFPSSWQEVAEMFRDVLSSVTG